MGLGLEGAYGAAGASDILRQIIKERFERQAALHDQSIRDQQLANQTRQLDQNDQLRRDQLTETARQHTLADEDRRLGIGEKLNDQIPAGFLPDSNQAVGFLRAIGAGADAPARPAMGPAFTGPMPDAETPPQAQAGRAKGFLKSVSAKQIADDALRQNVLADNARADAKDAQAQRNFDVTSAETARYHTGLINKPTPGADSVVKVEHLDPATGKTVIEYLPKSEVRGKTFQKGVGSALETRLASAQAVNQTGDDIIRQLSDPTVAAKLGPVMGRYAKLQDFVGNPPPEFSELAGAIESYSLANMGVHGMRSAQGAQLIAGLLQQPHNPASIIAAIKGLNKFSQHFMENEGRVPKKAGAAAAPTENDPLGIRK